MQAIAHFELEEGMARDAVVSELEILTENRFIAARDGMNARLLDPANACLIEARVLLADLLDHLRPHAEQLGCADDLEGVMDLAAHGGAARQRFVHGHEESLSAVLADLAGRF